MPLSFFTSPCLTDRSEYEVSVPDSTSGALEDSDSKASIFLPSEKLSDQVRTESNNPSEITAVDTKETVSDPIVVITFRPINRQFGRSVPLMFRRGRRECHHHHHNFKPWRLIGRDGKVSYGNDMIVPDEQSNPNSGGNWGSGREITIPSRWSEFQHVGPWDSYRSSDSKEDRKHLHHHHFHHHRQEEEEHEHKEKNGFLRNFRKFLNQFEF